MPGEKQLFLFTLPGSKTANSTRKVHIRRLYDILELSIHRGDLSRARRAWSILSRCKEVDWKALWKTGALLVGSDTNNERRERERLEYLTSMMLQYPDARETVIQEMILHLVLARKYKNALDELELYLPSLPYHENSVLHVYAGLISLYLTQPSPPGEQSSGGRTLRDAQQFFDRAKLLNPHDPVASAWLEKIPSLSQDATDRETPMSDDEDISIDDAGQRQKRLRT